MVALHLNILELIHLYKNLQEKDTVITSAFL